MITCLKNQVSENMNFIPLQDKIKQTASRVKVSRDVEHSECQRGSGISRKTRGLWRAQAQLVDLTPASGSDLRGLTATPPLLGHLGCDLLEN